MRVYEGTISNMIKQILIVTKPDPTKYAECSGNWPTDAEYAVVYVVTSKALPTNSRKRQAVYFNNKEKMDEWFKEQKELVTRTNNEYGVSGVFYCWDLGPTIISDFNI